jgi:hypothetical protein
VCNRWGEGIEGWTKGTWRQVFICLRWSYDPMQAELDGVVGAGRLPALADRDQLTYTAAVLLEVQRCGNIVPQGVHHMASR